MIRRYRTKIKETVGCHDTIIKGRIVIKDKFSNTVLEKDNLVVLRGRTFVLEKLFTCKDQKGNLTVDIPTDGAEYIKNSNRIPLLFTIGTGGALASQAGGNPALPVPLLPSYSDRNLAKQIPFVKEQLGANQNKYFDVRNTNEYYAKAFKSVTWGYDSERNQVYKKLLLEVESSDARGYSISEIGLLLAEPTYDANGNLINATDIELMTRVTFADIPLTSGDDFTIEYYLYG